MKRIEISRRFTCGPALLIEAVRRVLCRDKSATPSWAPDGRHVVVTMDRRNTVSLFLSWFSRFYIVDVSVADDGTIAVTAVTPSMFSAVGPLRRTAESVLDSVEAELKIAQPRQSG